MTCQLSRQHSQFEEHYRAEVERQLLETDGLYKDVKRLKQEHRVKDDVIRKLEGELKNCRRQLQACLDDRNGLQDRLHSASEQISCLQCQINHHLEQRQECEQQITQLYQDFQHEHKQTDLNVHRFHQEKERLEFENKKLKEQLKTFELDKKRRNTEVAWMLVDQWQNRCQAAEQRSKELERKLQILQEQSVDLDNDILNNDRNNLLDNSLEGSRFVSLKIENGADSVTKECRRCKIKFRDSDNHASACHYHSTPVAEFAMWKQIVSPDLVKNSTYHNYKYWMCCNKLQRNMPEGCQTGWHIE